MTSPFYSWQQEGIHRIRKRPDKRFILAYAPGGGKTRTALQATESPTGNTLVICPALARTVWEDELALWYPDWGYGTIDQGERKQTTKKKKLALSAAHEERIQICSYALLSYLKPRSRRTIILDELHYLQAAKSKQSIAVQQILKENPNAAVVGLTGSPIPNQVSNLWNPLHTIWPGQWGKPVSSGRYSYEFSSRYSNDIGTEWGPKFSGINERNLEELKARLAPIMQVVTSEEIARERPPFVVKGIRTSERDFPMKWIKERREDGTTHAVVLTHLRGTAEQLKGDFCLTGEQTVEQRKKVLEQFKQKGGVLCATMHCVRESINLGFVRRVLVCELPQSPLPVVQVTGRFSGLRNVAAVLCEIMVLEGDNSERRALDLLTKMKSIGQVIAQGNKEQDLQASLDLVQTDEELANWFSEIAGSASAESLLEREE